MLRAPRSQRRLHLRAVVQAELPAEVDWATNLGKFDFYPRASGKGNAVGYLQRKHGLAPAQCVALFDEDMVGDDDPLGRAEIPLAALHPCTEYDVWMPLQKAPYTLVYLRFAQPK